MAEEPEPQEQPEKGFMQRLADDAKELGAAAMLLLGVGGFIGVHNKHERELMLKDPIVEHTPSLLDTSPMDVYTPGLGEAKRLINSAVNHLLEEQEPPVLDAYTPGLGEAKQFIKNVAREQLAEQASEDTTKAADRWQERTQESRGTGIER